MFQILFILLSFDKYIHVNSSDFFTYYSYLKYGFKKNAEFYFRIRTSSTKMVFGLATQKELNKISTKKNKIEYCEGKYQLSSIQFVVDNNITAYSNKTSKRGYLTPYSFSCNTTYDFYLHLIYQNGKSHSDYRIQDAIIYTIILTVFYFILEVSLFIYSRCCKKFCHIFIDFYIIVNIIHFIFESVYLIRMSNNEFYDEDDSVEEILSTMDSCELVVLLCMSMVFIFVTEFRRMFIVENIGKYLLFFFCVLSLVAFPVTFCFIFKIESPYYFLTHNFYLLMFVALLCLPAKFSFTRIGLMLYFLGEYFNYVLNYSYLDDPDYSFRTFSIIQMNLIIILINLFATFFLLIDLFFFNDFDSCFGHHHISDTILTTAIPQINYTDLN